MVEIKHIYLNKYYLFQNKIYYFEKIYFFFAIMKLFKHTIKKEALEQMISCEFCKILKNTFFTDYLRETASKECLQTTKSLISSCRRIGETILSYYWQNLKITATVHYFHYICHHYYHYYHFHYHFKKHLYRLIILLTISFILI